jgi:hypothetical protein
LYTVLDFNYTVVFGKNLRSSPSSVYQIVPDCVASPIQSDSFGITADGGITPAMITINPTNPSSSDDYLNLNMDTSSFLYSDVLEGSVNIRPKLINTAFSARESKFNVLVRDLSSNALVMEAKYNVKWTFCPKLVAANVTIMAYSVSDPTTITSSMISIAESHGLSVWEQRWNLTSLSGGKLEYYCPDKICDLEGPRWIELPPFSTISHVL